MTIAIYSSIVTILITLLRKYRAIHRSAQQITAYISVRETQGSARSVRKSSVIMAISRTIKTNVTIRKNDTWLTAGFLITGKAGDSGSPSRRP
jgi:hypothetical protein